MSAAEIIQEIQRLPREERDKVADFFRKLEAESQSKKTDQQVSKEFERLADDIFTTNAELFRKLAQ